MSGSLHDGILRNGLVGGQVRWWICTEHFHGFYGTLWSAFALQSSAIYFEYNNITMSRFVVISLDALMLYLNEELITYHTIDVDHST
jgi:hypothetical protein